MLGGPGASLDDELETVELNIRCKVDHPLVSIMQPYRRRATRDTPSTARRITTAIIATATIAIGRRAAEVMMAGKPAHKAAPAAPARQGQTEARRAAQESAKYKYSGF